MGLHKLVLIRSYNCTTEKEKLKLANGNGAGCTPPLKIRETNTASRTLFQRRSRAKKARVTCTSAVTLMEILKKRAV